MTLLYTSSSLGDTDFKVGARRLDVKDFNTLPDIEACAALTRCCGSTRWVQAMMARRPFISFAELFKAADQIWWSLDPDDWLEAFSHHPRFGDLNYLRRCLRIGEKGELAGGQPARKYSEVLIDGIMNHSRDYEKKFGHIFIIQAEQLDPSELLGALHKRLRNDRGTELKVAAEQQRRIMTSRLSRWLTS